MHLKASRCLFQVLMVQLSLSVSQLYLLHISVSSVHKDALLEEKKIPGNTHHHTSLFSIIWHCFLFNDYKDFRNSVHLNSGSGQTDIEKIC